MNYIPPREAPIVEPQRTLQDRLNTAVEKLAVLGTADAIAMELAARGIRATPGCAESCLIAWYLHQEMPIGVFVDVNGSPGESGRPFGTWSAEVYELDGTTCVSAELPDHVGEVAERFDRGDWPELVRLNSDPR